jgi:hypothetical protein
MSDGFIGFIFALGLSGFAYSKLARTTGNGNVRNAITGAAIVFALGFIFLYTLMKYVLHI